MSFLSRLFGKKERDPASDPNMIKVYDGYGREMFVPRQKWWEDVLLRKLEENRGDPDQLYGILWGALQDGFAADIVPYAEHLHRTDPIPSRGAALLGFVYIENNRLNDAERILDDFLSAHGDDGDVLTNLAKVYSLRGDDSLAESTLLRGLEADPNPKNSLYWYTAIHREREGDTGELEAYRRVAKIPGSWRAQLCLARNALERGDLAAAEGLYEEALTNAETPPPSDLLMQMGGDLGNKGYLKEVIRFVNPHFDPAVHGLQVGNNLIKANKDLGRIDSARLILDQLYAQQRHDWQKVLMDWDTELAKANVARRPAENLGEISVLPISIKGPLWTRDSSPFATLLTPKIEQARSIAFLGSTVLSADPPKESTTQFTETSGRISRAIPLFFAERIHLHSDALGFGLIPLVQNQGFAVFGSPCEDQWMCDLAANCERPIDFLVGVTVDATQSKWNLLLRLIRMADRNRVAEEQVQSDPQNPGPAVERLARKSEQLLTKHAGVHPQRPPDWYRVPDGEDFSDYLIHLEQQLAIACVRLEFLGGDGLYGEHEILDRFLQLCVRQPDNRLVRMVFAQTLRQMRKTRPQILSNFKEKVELLQREHPLTGEIGELIETTISQAMASGA